MTDHISNHVLLASSSQYRKTLLSRLGIKFDTFSPHIDEKHHVMDTPKSMSVRLATNKAHAALSHYPDHLVIASDQVCALDQRIFSKPENHATNVQHLKLFSNHVVDFFTTVVVGVKGQALQHHVDRTQVRFRELSDDEIENYVSNEQAFECAGGFKVESLGPTLFESVDSQDPTALVGLPLIATSRMLRDLGVQFP